MKLLVLSLFCLFITSQGQAQMSTNEQTAKTESMAAPDLPDAGVPLYNMSGELSATDPTYDRRFGVTQDLTCNANSLDSGNDNLAYDVYPFAVSQNGPYEFETTLTGLSDSYIFIYCDFDPANPDQKLMDGNDDGGAGLASQININLASQQQYYLVVTSFGNGQLGTYDVEIRGPAGATITMAPQVVPTLGEWALISLALILMIVGTVAIGQRELAIA